MTKNYTVKSLGFVLVLSLALAGCRQKQAQNHGDLGKIRIDSALTAVVQSGNHRIPAQNIPTIRPQLETKIVMLEAQAVLNFDSRFQTNITSRVAGRIEKLYVNYNYQSVQKGQLLLEIYAPELVAAQKELLYLIDTKSQPDLIQAARLRLKLLGIDQQTIRQVEQNRSPLYRIPVYSPVSGVIVAGTANLSVARPSTEPENTGMASSNMETNAEIAETPLPPAGNTDFALKNGQYLNRGQTLFNCYSTDRKVAVVYFKSAVAAQIDKHNPVLLYRNNDKANTLMKVKIDNWAPEIKQNESWMAAKIYLNTTNLKVGDILTAKFPQLIENACWLPQSAIANLGNEQIVFRKNQGTFKAVPVKVVASYEGLVAVQAEVNRWEIAKNASYLIDSEGFIK
jgi:hypothetical protein